METRLGLLTQVGMAIAVAFILVLISMFMSQCNTPLCASVDGILGFGWTDRKNSASLLKTLTSSDRSDWGIVQPADFTVPWCSKNSIMETFSVAPGL